MKEFFLWLFTPKRNHYLVLGLVLTILGVILIPFIIGIPIAGIGFVIFSVGAMISLAERSSAAAKAVEGFKKMSSQMKVFVENIIHKPKNSEK